MENVAGKTAQYRKIIEELLEWFAVIPNLVGGIHDRTLFDERNDSYAIIAEGWQGADRVHNIVAHLEIINGKVWIQADNTDIVIARKLEAEGIPKSDIVLGFRLPEVRPETGYAVA